MIENRLIVCLASSWGIDPTSKHHLMRLLAARNDVVWVNYHASRRPRLNGQDASAAFRVLRRIAAGPKRISERMVQVTPMVVPGSASRTRDLVNRLTIRRQVQRAMRIVRRRVDQPVQLWTFAPDAACLAGAFGEECLVYYCVDEFSAFEGYDAAAVRRAEDRLLARADVVITSAQRLYDDRSARHGNVHLVRHGVEHGHFARAVQDAPPLPRAWAHLPRPIAGFIGLVQHWFDVALVAAVAARLPEVSFVLVGQVEAEVSALRRLPNVHLVGRRPYAELPAWCTAFDVGLIPFVRSPMTEFVNPIKLREYLAAGLPVVSTALPEVRSFQPDVSLADAPAAFAAACARRIRESTPAARAARSHRYRAHDWPVVVERVSRIVGSAAGVPSSAAVLPR